ncbi:21370_t:CDS:2 [Dentiscutata erythropus]|uniref:21370_t:CDS:1 n=1 Tax=Dentiscutata erythropus TaxID=1348616 RepID=A0A9N9A2T4_9GLOM|nr:21370_t:CDS:2 [Dentiscutata erythropus]
MVYDNISKQNQITTNNNKEKNFISPMDNSNLSFAPTSAPIGTSTDKDLELENNTFNAKKKTVDNDHKLTKKVTQKPE